MASGLNQLHAQDHSAELNRQAELHRLAARAREAREPKVRLVQIPHPGAAIFALLSRSGNAPRRARRA
ncbi:MAG TPA: hypothetical protein VIZ61_06720 [Solirubrobacterales bacterium]